jgi:hypothetical protein
MFRTLVLLRISIGAQPFQWGVHVREIDEDEMVRGLERTGAHWNCLYRCVLGRVRVGSESCNH